jgi:hypothetical protein
MLLETADAECGVKMTDEAQQEYRDAIGAQPVDELTPGQQVAYAATVEAIRRVAMAVMELPRDERAVQYGIIRKNFQSALSECNIVGPMADAWLDGTIIGIQALVNDIEDSGGAVGGQA